MMLKTTLVAPTKVNNTGDEVIAATFTGNTEISRIGGELRKRVFGDTSPHSESVEQLMVLI